MSRNHKPAGPTDEEREIGRRLAGGRQALGYSQARFALEVAGVSTSTVQRWEAGSLPTVAELIRVAKLLEVPVWEVADVDGTLADEIAAIRGEIRELRGLVEQIANREEALK